MRAAQDNAGRALGNQTSCVGHALRTASSHSKHHNNRMQAAAQHTLCSMTYPFTSCDEATHSEDIPTDPLGLHLCMYALHLIIHACLSTGRYQGIVGDKGGASVSKGRSSFTLHAPENLQCTFCLPTSFTNAQQGVVRYSVGLNACSPHACSNRSGLQETRWL